MARHDRATRTVEYGVQTSNSKTILTVTEDLDEAERTLDMLGQGRLVQRTVSCSPWIAVEVAAETRASPNEPEQDWTRATTTSQNPTNGISRRI
jgi:hypothetical protein